MTTIATIQSRVRAAVDQLIQADRNNPRTELTASELSGNPFLAPPGDNGQVDKKEASTLSARFTQSVYEAAGMKAGKPYLEGGMPGGFQEKIMAPFELPFRDLRGFQSHVNAIAAKLETDASGNVTQAALDALPATIENYFKTDLRNLDKPHKLVVESMARVLREAATGGVDWF
ncbi:MAG: hypothetical protein AB1938_23475 [Myxococcota bacterium]